MSESGASMPYGQEARQRQRCARHGEHGQERAGRHDVVLMVAHSVSAAAGRAAAADWIGHMHLHCMRCSEPWAWTAQQLQACMAMVCNS